MKEQLLQYIWQLQYFNSCRLYTPDGIPVQILYPGRLNLNQGPDFENAKIIIDGILWVGSVEVHLKASDWLKHGHQHNPHYKKVVLHVVYENDQQVAIHLPTIELKGRISFGLLKRYATLMEARSFIPCAQLIGEIPEIILNGWKTRLLAERLMRKAEAVLHYQEYNRQHWEESFWWLLARNFGLPVNAEAFEAIAKSITVRLLAKHKNQLQQLEALLLGQAGLLNDQFTDPYPKLLQREYEFLQKKYRLTPVAYPVQFLRMRPGNFPTIRLAQLAAVIHHSVHLFSKVIEEDSLKNVRGWFCVTANDFWHYHYDLREKSTFRKKRVGAGMINNIIINTIAPALFAYGTCTDKNGIKEKALRWLEETKPEKNKILEGFEAIGLSNQSAMDSQAFIELKNQYCDLRKCLQCTVGSWLLKQKK